MAKPEKKKTNKKKKAKKKALYPRCFENRENGFKKLKDEYLLLLGSTTPTNCTSTEYSVTSTTSTAPTTCTSTEYSVTSTTSTSSSTST